MGFLYVMVRFAALIKAAFEIRHHLELAEYSHLSPEHQDLMFSLLLAETHLH